MTLCMQSSSFDAGIIDPAKVTRRALQAAGSVVLLMITTQVMIADSLEEKEAAGTPDGYASCRVANWKNRPLRSISSS